MFANSKWCYNLFMKIAEPRHVRLVQFWVYIFMTLAGVQVMFAQPRALESVVGVTLVYIFAAFIILGSTLGAIAVLPGIWWLERVGVISIWTGLGMFLVMVIAIGSSWSGIAVSLVLILTFVLRWYEIKDWQLAPKKE